MTTYVLYERTLTKHLRIEEGPPVGASFAVHVGTSSSSSSLNQAHAQAIVKVPQSEEKLGSECTKASGDYGRSVKVEPSDKRLLP